MGYFWIEFDDGDKGSITAASVPEAMREAERIKGKAAKAASPLPYPANPRLNTVGAPTFCFNPERCKGRTSCPNLRGCDD